MVFCKEKFTYDNIEELKQDVGLKIGNIAELNGYYEAGDGANHKRIIANEDDGSGVQLANGLWANIVHNGEVNVSWFGAKGDGVQIENLFLAKAHSLKNVNLVKYDGSKIYRVKGGEEIIYANSSIDFCGATLKLEAINSKFDYVFVFKNETIWEEEAIIGKIRKGQNLNSNFNIKPNIFVEVIGEVNNVSGTKIQLSEYFYHINSGCVIGKSFANRLGGTIRYRELSKPIKISNVVIEEYYSGNPLDIVEKFHWSWFDISNYDNVTLENIVINDNGFVASRECFYIQKGFNIKVNNILFKGNTILGNNQGVNSAWGYFINLDKCINVEFDKFITPFTTEFTWSSYGMNNCKKIKINNCMLFRVDQHTLCQDIIVENSTINSAHLSGDGYRIFNNVLFVPYLTGYLFNNRGSSGGDSFNFYDGDIYMNNCVVRYPLDVEKISFFFCYGDTNSPEALSNSTMHSLFVDRLKFEYNNFGKETRRKLTLLDNYNDRELFYKCEFNNVDFSNVFIENFGAFHSNLKSNAKHKGTRDSNFYPVTCNMFMKFDNCQFNSEESVGYEEQRGVIILQNNEMGNLADVVPNIEFNNCTNVISSPNCYGIVTITNSTIQSFKFFSDADLNVKQKVYLYNNRFENCRESYYNYYSIGNYVVGDSHNIEINKETFLPKESADKMSNKINEQLSGIQKKYDDMYNPQAPVQQLSTSYMATKMQQKEVYDDYIAYMDEKTLYDKQQEKLEKERQLAYEQALKENPNLSYEEFMSVQPMVLNLMEEPQPSEALKRFMEKYL